MPIHWLAPQADPTDAGLGLETGLTPALARLACLEEADATGYQKAEYHLLETSGIDLAVVLGSKEHPDYMVRLRQWAKRLLKNGVEKLITEVRQECAGNDTLPLAA